MRDMKNGIQKSHKMGIVKYLKDINKKREDLYKIVAILIIGIISSITIQPRFELYNFLGNFLIATVILFIFYKDIERYKPGYLTNRKMLLLLGILVAGTLLLARVYEYFLLGLQRGLNLPEGNAYIYGLPIPLGAMIVKLIFDFHTAITFSFAISLLAGILFNDPLYTVYVFIGSLIAAFGVMRCKKRSDLIKGGLYVSLVNVMTASIVILLKGEISLTSSSVLFFAFLSGLIVSVTVFFLLPLIEYLFSITTDISLVELLDLDQPLMKNLMINAPGTYHHSVIVGNLAEAAAEAVGANPLLARVTAYYHDIGKLKMPEYFIENQIGTSKHEKLTPHMSSMILISHVKEGVELAQQYKLPKLISDIIQQHHGTSLIAYFYQKAIEQSTDVSQENYRYPGPKPQTRVAAIVMMADAVEAASRALTDPTPARISALVDKIINNIFIDGQIDECELTLKDISEIKKRFKYILTSIFHKRVEYPEIKSGNGKLADGDSRQELSKIYKS
jgi:putative nucleotidyltransferase with HDIG domain